MSRGTGFELEKVLGLLNNEVNVRILKNKPLKLPTHIPTQGSKQKAMKHYGRDGED